MFGTVVPSVKRLGKSNKCCYHGYYCGLCFALGQEFGKQARFLLNYDLTNDYLLAAAAVDAQCDEHVAVCPYSWKRKKVHYIDNPELTRYFAHLNYLMVYYKLLDDQADDQSRLASWLAKKMQPKLDVVNETLSTERQLLTTYLSDLHELERENAFLPVFSVAERFGVLLQYMVAPPLLSELDREVFSRINYWVGVWIYTADAMEDCLSDYSKKRYNPILAGTGQHPFDVMRFRRKELLDLITQCRNNLQDLVLLYPAGEKQDLLLRLFDLQLPFRTRKLLGVKKNDIIA